MSRKKTCAMVGTTTTEGANNRKTWQVSESHNVYNCRICKTNLDNYISLYFEYIILDLVGKLKSLETVVLYLY